MKYKFSITKIYEVYKQIERIFNLVFNQMNIIKVSIFLQNIDDNNSLYIQKHVRNKTKIIQIYICGHMGA